MFALPSRDQACLLHFQGHWLFCLVLVSVNFPFGFRAVDYSTSFLVVQCMIVGDFFEPNSVTVRTLDKQTTRTTLGRRGRQIRGGKNGQRNIGKNRAVTNAIQILDDSLGTR